MPNTIPSGTVIAFAGPANKIPAGWLVCDGKIYDRTKPDYKPLFDAIGVVWGGDGANKFAVPDLRGLFVRGVADTATTDPDKDARDHSRPDLADSGSKGNAVGSKQSFEIQSHTHSVDAPILIAEGGHGFSGSGFSSNSNAGSSRPSVEAVGGNETRPVNAYVYYIIKL